MRRKASSEVREEQMDTAEFFRFKICSSSQTFTAFRRAVMTVTDQLWCRNLLVKKNGVAKHSPLSWLLKVNDSLKALWPFEG